MSKLMELLQEIRPDADFEKSTNFIEDGYLDSLDLMSLIEMLEQSCKIHIDIEHIVEENFKDIPSILNMIQLNGGDIHVFK